MSTAFEPRTSLERALIDSDPEGQLYLEARRQQALDRLRVDLDHHRLSRLSTITPPSSTPSSAASSIIDERMGSKESCLDLPLAEQGPPPLHHPSPPLHRPGSAPLQTPLNGHPRQPHALSPPSSRESTPECDSPSFSFHSSKAHSQQQQQQIQDSPKTMRKTRHYLARKRNNDKQRDQSLSTSPSAAALPLSLPPPPLPFNPSSLEYQLTASLLAHPSPSSTRAHHSTAVKKKASQSSFTKRSRRRSRQGSQPYGITIDTSPSAAAAASTISGSKYRERGGGGGGAGGQSGLSSSRVDGKTTAAMLAVEPMAPFSTDDSPPSTWSPSPPASPFGGSALEGSSAFVLGSKASMSALSMSQPTTTNRPPPSMGVVVEPPPLTDIRDQPTPPQPTTHQNISIPLPPVPPSPPLPPVPPKTLSGLIAQYFPGSLPPPPPRVAGAGPRRGSAVATPAHAVDIQPPAPTLQHETGTPASIHTTPTAPGFSPSPHGSVTQGGPEEGEEKALLHRPSLQLPVKTPTFGPAVFTLAGDAPPVPTTRMALFHMASSMAAAASAAAAVGASSSDSVFLSRSRSKAETIATVSSTTSGSSSPESLHPALVSTSAFGVIPPSPPMRHHRHSLTTKAATPPLSPLSRPPPNTTVAIQIPFPLPKSLAPTGSSATATLADEEEVKVDSDSSIPPTHSMTSACSTQKHVNTNHPPTTTTTTTTTASRARSSSTAGSAILSAAPRSSSPQRFSPLGPRPGTSRRPSMTPHGSFDGQYPSTGGGGGGGGGTGGTGGSGAELFYPTSLKNTTTAGPSALLGSKLSPHYYRAALYNSDSSSSSTSSLQYKTRRGGSGDGGSGADSAGLSRGAHTRMGVITGSGTTATSLEEGMAVPGRGGLAESGTERGKSKKKRRGKKTGVTTSDSHSSILSLDPRSRIILSMTSSELDPLHYLETKPLPAVRRSRIGAVGGDDGMDLESHDDEALQGKQGRLWGRLLFLFFSCSSSPKRPQHARQPSKYWVFRDQDGWMLGPWLFLCGFLFPPLWWIGALYRARPPQGSNKPRPPMPKKRKETEIDLKLFRGAKGRRADELDEKARREQQEVEKKKAEEGGLVEVAENGEALHSTILPPPSSSGSSQAPPVPMVLDMRQLARVETPPHGPWSVEHKATLMFQERMIRDRRARRAELEARWRTVNLVFAFSSLVLVVAICAVVFAVIG